MIAEVSILTLLGAANMTSTLKAAPVGTPIFPRPQEIRWVAGKHFEFRSNSVVYDATGGKVSKHLAAMLKRAAGIQLKETADRARVWNPGVVAFVPSIPGSGLKAEGYSLSVTEDAITVKFADDAGAFYAIQTLRQLLPKEIESEKSVKGVHWTVPQVEIRDWPRFSWRGMHLDVSRHFFPPAFIKRYIDFIAMHKMNRFHWHLTDDGGWRMEVKKFPKLTDIGAWRVDTGGQWPGGNWNYSELRFPGPTVGQKLYGGFYSQVEIKDIVAYAADRHVVVVPEIEMPGHELAATVAYPEFACDNVPPSQFPGFNPTDNFCPGKDETLRFLEDVLDETMALFPSKWIHVGADEVWKGFWQKCPKCQSRIKVEGLSGPEAAAKGFRGDHTPEENLQSWFVRHMEDYLWQRGRRLIGWDEILEGGLAPGATVMSWRGIEGGIAAAKSGHEAVMSPTSHCYFDYGYQQTSTKHVYGWEPVPAELSEAEARFILGGQANVWTEWIPNEDRVEYMIFPRMLSTAEVLWLEKDKKDWDDFNRRLAPYYARLDLMGADFNMPQPEIDYGAVLFDDSAVVAAKQVNGVPFALRYTTDGSAPTTTSPEYKGPITVKESCVVTFAYVNGQGKPGDMARTECRKFTPPKDLGVLIPGLKAEAFDGDFSVVPDFSNLKPAWSGYTDEVSDAVSGKAHEYALRFSGYFDAPRDGVYTFNLSSDDGSILRLAGAMVVNNDGLHGAAEKSASIRLRKGLYPIEIGYFEQRGAKSLKALVEGPGLAKQDLAAPLVVCKRD